MNDKQQEIAGKLHQKLQNVSADSDNPYDAALYHYYKECSDEEKESDIAKATNLLSGNFITYQRNDQGPDLLVGAYRVDKRSGDIDKTQTLLPLI